MSVVLTLLESQPLGLSFAANSLILPPSCGGAIAQLGERDNGIVEVRGSIPLGSTNFLFFCKSVAFYQIDQLIRLV